MSPAFARIDENRSFAVLRMTGGIGFLDTTSATHRIDRRDVAGVRANRREQILRCAQDDRGDWVSRQNVSDTSNRRPGCRRWSRPEASPSGEAPRAAGAYRLGGIRRAVEALWPSRSPVR